MLAKGHTATELAGLTHYIELQQTNGGIPNEGLVTNLNVQGEIAGLIPLASRIGNNADLKQQNDMFLPQSDLHSIALLTAFRQSGDLPSSTSADHTLGQATYKLTDLLKMIFDKNLFAHDTDTTDENFLERLVKHEAGIFDPVTGADTLSFAADDTVQITIPAGQDSVTLALLDNSNSNTADVDDNATIRDAANDGRYEGKRRVA